MKKNHSTTQQIWKLNPTLAAGLAALWILLALTGCPPPSKPALYYSEGDLCLKIDSTQTDCHPVDGRMVAIGIEDGKFYLRPLKSPRPADTTGFGDYPFWMRGIAGDLTFQTNAEGRNVVVSDKGAGRSKTLHIEEGQHLLVSGFSKALNGTLSVENLLEIIGEDCDRPAKLDVDEQRLSLVNDGGELTDSIEAVIIRLKTNGFGAGLWEADYVYLDENMGPGIGTMAIGDPAGGDGETARLVDSIFGPSFEEARELGPPGPMASMRAGFTDRDRVMGLWTDPALTDLGANWVHECSIPIDNVSFWVNCEEELIIRDGNDIAYVLNFSGCRIGLLAAKPDANSPPETLEIYYDENSCSQPDIYLENNNYTCP